MEHGLESDEPLADDFSEQDSNVDDEEDEFVGRVKISSSDYQLSDDSSDGDEPEQLPSTPNQEQGLGSVRKRAELTLREQNEIARKQFAPLPAKHQKWYDRICKILFKVFEKIDWEPGELVDPERGLVDLVYKDFVRDGFSLTWADTGRLFVPVVPDDRTLYDPFPTTSATVTDNYFRLFCKYVNVVRANQEDDGISCAVMSSPHDFRIGRFNRVQRNLAIVLREMKITSELFFKLDYLFLPYMVGDAGYHYVLLGIAPKQQFSFAMDSIATESWSMDREEGMIIQALLLHFGSGVNRKEGEEKAYSNVEDDNDDEEDEDSGDESEDQEDQQQWWEDEEWDFFSQWSQRSQTTDESPNGPQQRDYHNCGTFTMTSAFCLAFGFNLQCYKNADLDDLKRPRIAAELYNGFSGEFGYDMFDLLAGRSDRVGVPPPYREEVEKNDDEMEGVVHGIHPNGGIQSWIPDGGKIRDAATALALEKTWPRHMRPKRRIPRPFPQQFSPEQFVQGGLLYATPKSINYDPKQKYSVEDLKDACRRFPLEGWEQWSDMPKRMFLRWMLNEMGAFMSLARGDTLKPTPGLAKGFDKWKEQQISKVRQKRMIQLLQGPEEAKRGSPASKRQKK
ncbi:hypothetical protein L207DRAFT_505147 [Hyaloscypha variabilis F]|uniref:Ubiquitin-like protease family profile domain-containing protein n=1 Tax=Hyaloscypha variabilis (strain UAMH 11265 / GT02V1 / F) TaxID=1149755 RepID=A0A2J6SBC6_HYAVF|nr:hypothetical protein L207DRAFT_505147 [Hyaloscypha variabilis F]